MSFPNNYIITMFFLNEGPSVRTRNLTYNAITGTLYSYGALIAFHLNGAVYVNGATKKLSGTSLSKTTAGHINRVISLAAYRARTFAPMGQALEVYSPVKFDLLYQSVVATNEATKAYMATRKKEVEF